MLRYRLGVVNVVKGTAAVLCGTVALEFREAALIPELHCEADDGAALLLQESGDSGGVDATGHSYSDEAALCFGALGQGVELYGCIHAESIIANGVAFCLRRTL